MRISLSWPPFVTERVDRLLRPASPMTPGGTTTLAQRDIYILPTKHGLLFVVVLFAMLLGAMNYNNSLGFLLTFLLGSMSIVSILHAYRNLAGLQILGIQATSVFAGQQAPFKLELKNHRPTARLALSLSIDGEPHTTVDIPASTTQVVTIHKPAPKRGKLPVGRITLESRFPLSLFRAWTYLKPDAFCIVYPQPAPPQPLPKGSGKGGDRSLDEETGVEDFRGFRDYHAGDSPRHIYWKALAREQGIRVKQFSATQAEVLWLEWEQSEGVDSELRLSQLCRWALDANRLGQPFGLRLPANTVQPALGEEHLRQSLTALALFKPN